METCLLFISLKKEDGRKISQGNRVGLCQLFWSSFVISWVTIATWRIHGSLHWINLNIDSFDATTRNFELNMKAIRVNSVELLEIKSSNRSIRSFTCHQFTKQALKCGASCEPRSSRSIGSLKLSIQSIEKLCKKMEARKSTGLHALFIELTLSLGSFFFPRTFFVYIEIYLYYKEGEE